MEGGFIKLNRKLLKWEWYSDMKTKNLFIHCLIMANWKDATFRGMEVPRGSFITSLPSLSEQTNMSIQSVRTAIDHLISTGEITVTKYPHWRMITVVKYNDYQDSNSLNNSPSNSLNDSQSTVCLTSIEEYKNKKNNKKGRIEPNPDLKAIEDLYQQEVENDKL